MTGLRDTGSPPRTSLRVPSGDDDLGVELTELERVLIETELERVLIDMLVAVFDEAERLIRERISQVKAAR